MKLSKIILDKDVIIKPLDDRWYEVQGEVNIEFHLENEGVVHIRVDHGFMLDGRSGPRIVDYFVPNLGTQEEVKTWFIHDLLSYDIYFSFEENNNIFYNNLRNWCKYGWFKAKTIWSFVSVSDDYFGEPLPTNREYPNLKKIHVRHNHK